jgi:transposase
MHQIHPNARTTPALRAEIARSAAPSGLLAQRYGVSAETIRKWRKRGAADCLDRSARAHTLPWKATAEERAVVCALRQSTNCALDDLTFVVRRFLLHLNRDSIWRILKAEGLPVPSHGRGAPGQGGVENSRTTVSASFTSISNSCRCCEQPMASDANAISMSSSTAVRAQCAPGGEG